jgi:hypothetical protein
MDLSTTCGLVTTTLFTSYAQIVDSSQKLVEFNMGSNYVTGKTTVDKTNDFTSYITTSSNFTGGKPTLPSGKQSIVTALGYPIPNSTYSNDFKKSTATPTDMGKVVTDLIKVGDLCSSNDIYSITQYNGTNAPNLSLTTLYRTLDASNVSVGDKVPIKAQIDVLQNKNKMFYSFFVYEYCYYNTMYTTLINEFFNEYKNSSYPTNILNIGNLKDSQGATAGPGSTATAQATRLDSIAITMARVNSRLIDMRALLSAIQNYYSAALQNYQETLNADTNNLGSDMNVQDNVTYLHNQAPHVEHAKDQSHFRQGIMEYTSEKNRYSNILLGIYAFLNIAIVAVIFNIKE